MFGHSGLVASRFTSDANSAFDDIRENIDGGLTNTHASGTYKACQTPLRLLSSKVPSPLPCQLPSFASLSAESTVMLRLSPSHPRLDMVTTQQLRDRGNTFSMGFLKT